MKAIINKHGQYFNVEHMGHGSNACIIENFSTVDGGIQFYAKGDGEYRFHTTDSNYERMRILNNGNVGIGTSSPGNTLEVNGVSVFKDYIHVARGSNTINNPYSTGIDLYNSGSGDTTLALRCNNTSSGSAYVSFDNANQYGWCFGMDGSDSNKIKLARVWNDLGSSTALTVTTGGFVGIGTTTPHAKLQVNGTGGYIQAQYYQRFRYDHTISGANQWGGLGGISIYGSNEIVSGSFFVSHNGSLGASDQRIKKNIVDADDAECLDVLRQLKPKKYEYKDVVKKGEEPVWGFIAQEVANVLPHATQLRQEFIPNIYELANVSSSNVITFTDFNTSNLESNALIRTKGIDGEDHDIHLEEVIDEHTIRVKEDLTLWIGSVDETGNAVAGNQLFVYGQEVDDFAFLKKEAIWTVATSALQEVDRIQQQLVDQVADLEAANDAKERRIDDLEERLNALVARMEAVENA